MSLPNSDWTYIIKGMLAGIGLLSILMTFFVAGPWIETRFMPVLSKLEFVSIQPDTENTSIVRVKFTKNKDCEYMGMAWYVTNLSGISDRVSMVPIKDPNDTSSPNRMVGTQYAGPWRIGLTLKDIREKSYVLVYHRCHPFWTTTTVFYP